MVAILINRDGFKKEIEIDRNTRLITYMLKTIDGSYYSADFIYISESEENKFIYIEDYRKFPVNKTPELLVKGKDND